MKRRIEDFIADEDPSDLFDDALDHAELEDDRLHADDGADDADFERDLHLLAAARRAAKAHRRLGR